MAKRSIGGSAGSGGYAYQHAVAAWFAACILAESASPPPLDLHASSTLSWLRCESDQPVDDIMVGTSESGFIFCQTKRSVSLSPSADSEFGKAIGQFVRQFVNPGRLPGRSAEKPLDEALDRLVLVCGVSTAKTVQVHLRRVLDRLRGSQPAEPILNSAHSQMETRALETMLSVARSCWREATGKAPSKAEVRAFLQLVRVVTLDCEAGGADEQRARNLLRESVLVRTQDDAACWALLLAICSDLAVLRNGLNLKQVQTKITSASIAVRSARSYRDDILRLQQTTEANLQGLSHLSFISFGTQRIKITREVTKALGTAAQTQSVLLIGEPGSGKSGVLHDFAQHLKANSLDVVYLPADRLDAANLNSLSIELGLSRELCEVLENWRGTAPAYLLVDALDAARAEPATRTLRELLRQVKGLDRWRVVASIRKFDLRYSPEIQTVFRGMPSAESKDPEFSSISHVLVKWLSDAELAQVAAQASELESSLKSVPRDLVRIVFNLKILAELVDLGVDIRNANPIETQLELLELYWKYRVLDGPSRDAREHLLRKSAGSMVKKKTMWADRAEIDCAGPELHELLSRGVLLEWQAQGSIDRNKLAFSHHVLFDFAVSTLLFRGDDNVFTEALLADHQMVLIARPSIVFHYHHVWSHGAPELKRFWNLVFRLQTISLPSIGKLIGPSVAVERSRTINDFRQLIDEIRTGSDATRVPSEQILSYIVGSLLCNDRQFVGDDAGPWCELAAEISTTLSPSVAYNLRSLLSRIGDDYERMTPEQLAQSGTASRNLLEYAWSQTQRDRFLVVSGLESVCKTYRSDERSSSRLLRRALEPEHITQFGYEELPWIARQLAVILPVDAAFVEDLYCAVFGHEESSTEPVQMGSSRLLALTSTRRQDFEGARWELGRFFPKFMSSDPIRATFALISCVDSYVRRDRIGTRLDLASQKEEEFDLFGTKARIAQDYSGIWDRAVVHHKDDIVVMLDAFGEYLKNIMATPRGENDLDSIMRLVIAKNRWAVIWRKVLTVASQEPHSLGVRLKELSFAKPVIEGFDTSWAVGEFLRTVFPVLSGPDKERAERAILGIVQGDLQGDKYDALVHLRDRLLGCLPRDQLVLADSIAVVERLSAAGGAPANAPPFQMEFSSAPFGEKEYLAEEGVQVDSEQNRRIRELEAPIKGFATKYLNAEPPLDELRKLAGPLELLWRGLLSADESRVDPKQADYAWGSLAEACSRIPAAKAIPCAEPFYSLIRDILLRASVHHVPEPDPEGDARFDEMASWGGPAARIDAASGLVRLCRHASCANDEVLRAVERLSADPVPAVRYQVACYLNALFETGTGLMWELAERFARTDLSRGVIHGLLGGSFQALARADPDRIAFLIGVILDRVTEGPGTDRVREAALETLSGLYIWRGNGLAADRINAVLGTVPIESNSARYVLTPARQAMTHGPLGRTDSTSEAVRRRAFDTVQRLLASALGTLEELEKQEIPFSTWSEEAKAAARDASEVADLIAREIYFASGAFKEKDDSAESLSHARRKRFYEEAVDAIDLLCTCGIPSVAHHLLETLESVIPIEPRRAFLQIGQVIEGGKRGGYQYESMAADLAVRLVEQYMAEYRSLLENDDECRRALIAILDTFVAAGWPAALRLSYRLQDIFR